MKRVKPSKGTTARTASISDLLPDERNANKGTERGLGMLEQSLRSYGAGRSVLLDKHGKIIAGNKTIEMAGSLGFEKVLVVESDGTQIVAVQRTDLDMDRDPRARELAIADNRVAEVDLDWNPDVLAELAKDVDLTAFWKPEELAELLGEEPGSGDAPEAQLDRAEELHNKWGTGRGQLWEIPSTNAPGRVHRLLCGDSTSKEDVARLWANMPQGQPNVMVTDPPYGVEYDPRQVVAFRVRKSKLRKLLSHSSFTKKTIHSRCLNGKRFTRSWRQPSIVARTSPT